MTSTKESTFFTNRLIELIGLIFISISLFITLAFFTFDPADPSMNYVTDGQTKNLAGAWGAHIIAPLISFIGYGTLIFAIVPFVWGSKLIVKSPHPHIIMEVFFFLLLIPVAATFSMLFDSAITPPDHWPDKDLGLGGFIGNFISTKLVDLISFPALASASSILFFITLFAAMGLKFSQWFLIFTLSIRLVKWIIDLTLNLMAAITNYIAELLEKNENADQIDPIDDQITAEDAPAKTSTKSKASARNERKSLKLSGDGITAPTPTKAASKISIVKKSKSTPLDDNEDNTDYEPQGAMDLTMVNNYQLPPIDLLQKTKKTKQNLSENSLAQNAELLEKVLEDYGVKGKIVEVRPGPVVTLYALEPSPGTKSARVIGLADDIARSMSATSARIAVVPGQNAIGIELPNADRATVYLRELLASKTFKESQHNLPLALGKDIGGEPLMIDLAKTPHMLVAGTTGSGKSVGINTMILSLLYKYSPEECKFIMIDPKMLELSVYADIPHLLSPVVTEPGKAVVALKWTVKEMENRYKMMSNIGVRNIYGYNEKVKEAMTKGEELTRSVQTGFDPETGSPIIEVIPMDMKLLPFIVVIVDEMADLMLVGGKEIETSVQRLAQMARAAGIHVVLATQRPSVDVITGIIKANFPTRLSFQVSSKIDSRTILGEQGAEQLLGMGDMLYMGTGNKLVRVHGPFVSDQEVERVVGFVKKQARPNYVSEVLIDDDLVDNDDGMGGETDELYDKAVEIVLRDGKASTSYIQRSLRIGYNRAANIIDQMEQNGVISKADHVGRREVIGA